MASEDTTENLWNVFVVCVRWKAENLWVGLVCLTGTVSASPTSHRQAAAGLNGLWASWLLSKQVVVEPLMNQQSKLPPIQKEMLVFCL